MIENEKHKIAKLETEIAVINTKLDKVMTNDLAHIQKDVDRIMYVLGAVGLAVLGELFILINAVL